MSLTVNSNGSLQISTPMVCNDLPTQNNQLVNKLYVDNAVAGVSGGVINQINLASRGNVDSNGNVYINLTKNTFNYCTNNFSLNSYNALGSGVSVGSFINATAIDSNGNVYVGGSFTSATNPDGTTVAANRIAMWNGSTWSALGGGLNNTCNAIAIDSSNNVYAGGDFTVAGNVAGTSRIAMWNGSTWSALGSGLISSCNAIAIDNSNNVYVGGDFTAAGGVVGTSRIAMWNRAATTWSALGGGLSGTCRAIAIDSANNVYVGGDFTTATNPNATPVTVNRIAMWNGSTWSALGSGINNLCYAIAIDSSNNVYVGGDFITATNPNATTVIVNRIAMWNRTATTWSALGSGVSNGCRSIVIDKRSGKGDVYIGGVFATAGGVTVNNITRLSIGVVNRFSINLYVNNKLVFPSMANVTCMVNVTDTNIPYSSSVLY